MNSYTIHLANGQLEEWNNVTLKFAGSWVILVDENDEDHFVYPAHKISHIEAQEEW